MIGDQLRVADGGLLRRHRHGWVGVSLVGGSGLRDQYGARIGLDLDDGRTLWRRVRADGSYCSSNDPRVLFGLGDASSVRGIEVLWPDGLREAWEGSTLLPGRYHTLQQGTGQTVSR